MILDPDYVPKPKPKPKPKPTPKPKPKSDPKPGPGYDIVRLTTTKDLAGNHIKKFKIKVICSMILSRVFEYIPQAHDVHELC